MSKGASVLKHPDRDKITDMLLQGVSVQKCAQWTRTSYPNDRKKWLAVVTLQGYRKNYLDVQGDVIKELREEAKRRAAERKLDEGKQLVRSSLLYVDKKKEAVQGLIDTSSEFLKLHDLIHRRIQLLENAETKYQNDRVIAEYISQARGLLNDYYRLVEGLQEGSDVSVNIDFSRHFEAFKLAIKDVLTEVGTPELISKFFEKLEEKLSRGEHKKEDIFKLQKEIKKDVDYIEGNLKKDVKDEQQETRTSSNS